MADNNELIIRDLHVNVEDKEILHGINLHVKPGEVHVIMGPNGSGKSTLSNALMGHPRYTITSGEIEFQGQVINGLSPDRRARRGIFLAFQNPLSVPGVTVTNFLRTALTNRRKGDVAPEVRPQNLDVVGDRPVYETKKASVGGDGANIDRKARRALISPKEFRSILKEKLNLLKMDEKFTKRYLNDGFSGGEKKRLEVLQMAVLEPRVAFLDEPDSGLDIDAIRIVGEGVNALRGKEMAIVVITHQQRILSFLDVDYVHVMMQGNIVKEGGPELSREIEEKGYGWIRDELGIQPTQDEAREEVGGLMPSLVQGFSWEAAEQFSAHNNEPDWLREKRRAGWDAFLSLPTPDWTRGIRGWWNSALKPLNFDELTPFTVAGTGSLPDNLDLDNPKEVPAGLIVQHNSGTARLELSEEARSKGVVLSSLTEAVQTHPEIVREYFMTRCVPVDEDRFTAAHAAFWSGGVFLYVPKDVVIDKPFRSIYYTDQTQAALFSHTLIVTGANVHVRLVEEHRSNGQATDASVLDSGVTEIFVGENSRVEYYNPQEYGENVTSIAVKRSMVGKHGIQRWIVANLGGDTSWLTLRSVLEGEGAHAETTGLAFPIHKQHFDTQFRQLHTVPHTTANSVFKQVLNDDSQLGFRGGIRTLKKAQFTDSFLQVHTLYLNDASKADILPFLDVDANDVRCAHGATTGMIDKDQIFYLQSRGLSWTQAEEMIVAGFFEEGIQRIPLESVQERLRESILVKLEG